MLVCCIRVRQIKHSLQSDSRFALIDGLVKTCCSQIHSTGTLLAAFCFDKTNCIGPLYIYSQFDYIFFVVWKRWNSGAESIAVAYGKWTDERKLTYFNSSSLDEKRQEWVGIYKSRNRKKCQWFNCKVISYNKIHCESRNKTLFRLSITLANTVRF